MTTPSPHEIRRAQVAALARDGNPPRAIAAQLGLTLEAAERHVEEARAMGTPQAIARRINAAADAPAPRGWRDQAACRGMDPEVFFPTVTDGPGVHYARSVCATCPVLEICGNWAIDHPNLTTHGVTGGLTEEERKRVRRNRVRAASLAAEGSP